MTILPDLPTGRQVLAGLTDVQAPFPMLHDQLNESFQALRIRVGAEAGWDALASLENAFVPLTVPLSPGLGEDWLYTGRAFALNPLPVNAGWMAVIPEDFAGQRYWRIFLKARFQDGSQGKPLVSRPWDFNARASGDPQLYEQGGQLSPEVPPGYWLDFTALAAAYGWERLPALFTWRSTYAAARFNEFIFSGGLDWRAAMLELYPEEILVTPTAMIPPTHTPTSAPPWYRTSTPTDTPIAPPTLTPLPPSSAP
jgi:TolB protein